MKIVLTVTAVWMWRKHLEMTIMMMMINFLLPQQKGMSITCFRGWTNRSWLFVSEPHRLASMSRREPFIISRVGDRDVKLDVDLVAFGT